MGKKKRERQWEEISLCDLRKEIKENLDRYRGLVRKPTHLCLKCGRAANNPKNLCKPEEL